MSERGVRSGSRLGAPTMSRARPRPRSSGRWRRKAMTVPAPVPAPGGLRMWTGSGDGPDDLDLGRVAPAPADRADGPAGRGGAPVGCRARDDPLPGAADAGAITSVRRGGQTCPPPLVSPLWRTDRTIAGNGGANRSDRRRTARPAWSGRRSAPEPIDLDAAPVARNGRLRAVPVSRRHATSRPRRRPGGVEAGPWTPRREDGTSRHRWSHPRRRCGPAPAPPSRPTRGLVPLARRSGSGWSMSCLRARPAR